MRLGLLGVNCQLWVYLRYAAASPLIKPEKNLWFLLAELQNKGGDISFACKAGKSAGPEIRRER
jgi:hypothetical protein